MTRDELIASLQAIPDNLPVAYYTKFDGSHEPTKAVKISKVHLFGGQIKKWRDLKQGENCIEIS
jgi:hypothetical protein